MKRSLVHKLALLGLTSSCLISAAYAGEPTTAAANTIFTSVPEVADLTCNSQAIQYLEFTITNAGSTTDSLGLPVIIQNSSSTDLDNNVELSINSYGCSSTLNSGDSCSYTFRLDTIKTNSALPCGSHGQSVDGEVQFKIIVPSESGNTIAEFEVDVTPIGSARDFSIIADQIHDHAGSDGWIQVNQDVSTTGHVSSHILYEGTAQYFYAHTDQGGSNAFYDAAAGYLQFKDIIDGSTCRDLDADLGNVSLEPATYCFGDRDDDYLTMSNTITFNGPGRYILYVPNAAATLRVFGNTEFVLNGADPEDIYIVGATSKETAVEFRLDDGAHLAGTWMTAGKITAGEDHFTQSDVGPAEVLGRLLGVSSEYLPCSFDTNCYDYVSSEKAALESIFTLDGNAINAEDADAVSHSTPKI